MPSGLGGNWTLLKASCLLCSETTSKFELDVLRKLLGTTRAALGIRSNHSKYPDSFPIEVESRGKKSTVFLPKDKHGVVTMLPIFKLPVCLENRPYNKGIDIVGSTIFRVGGTDLKAYANSENLKSLSFKWEFKPVDFARMIAKIAYGFSIWHNGIGYFKEVYILPSILNQKDEIGRWVGTLQEPIHNINLPAEDFVINFFNNPLGDEFAQLRLFGKFANTPTYVIAIGRKK